MSRTAAQLTRMSAILPAQRVTLDKTLTRESYTLPAGMLKALTQKITSVTMNSDKTVYAGWEATGVPDKPNGDDHFAYVIGYPTARYT